MRDEFVPASYQPSRRADNSLISQGSAKKAPKKQLENSLRSSSKN